jgi:SAM-dependent methyltransferase
VQNKDNGFYEQDYKNLFYDGGSAGWATRRIHKALEKYPRKFHFDEILEIGGGGGLHVEYVHNNYSMYTLTDILDVPLETFPQKMLDQGRLRKRIENAESLSCADNSVDRVIFMCVLHHIPNVEIALKESRRVVKDGGLVSIYLPCDPGFVYRFCRKFFTEIRAKRLGIDYRLVNAREHQNHFHQLNTLIRHVFEFDEIKVQRWPIPFLYYDFNLYFIFQIKKIPSIVPEN